MDSNKMRDRINAGVQQLDQGQYRIYGPNERERFIHDVESASEKLRRQIHDGIDDLNHGRYRDYGEEDLDQLIDDVVELDERRNPENLSPPDENV
jgi:hypothetical protein